MNQLDVSFSFVPPRYNATSMEVEVLTVDFTCNLSSLAAVVVSLPILLAEIDLLS